MICSRISEKLKHPKCPKYSRRAQAQAQHTPFILRLNFRDPTFKMFRYAKGPALDGSRGFTSRSAKAAPAPPTTYDVQVNGRTCLRGVIFPAAMIATRGQALHIQRYDLATLEPHHKRILINGAPSENFLGLTPGDYTINVGPYTITVIGRLKDEPDDGGVLPCGCIDVCRSCRF